MAGRRTKFTPELGARIVANLRLGCFERVAAESAGVAYGTFRDWVGRGEGVDPDRASTPAYAAFAVDVRKAKAEARRDAEWAVRKDTPLAWLRYGPGRDRGDPDNPGWTESPKEISGPGGGPIAVEGTLLVTGDEDEYVAQLKALRAKDKEAKP